MVKRIDNLSIRDARENLRLMPIDVANEIGVSVNYYRDIEDGIVAPSKDELTKICNILELNLDDIYDANVKETKVLCIFNAKGGVGKTVCTASLASALAAKDKKVLCVDLDSQCNLTNNLNMDSESDEGIDSALRVGDLFKQTNPFNEKIEKYISCTEYKNIDLVLGSHDLNDSINRVIHMNAKEQILNYAFKELIAKNEYDYILFDNHPGASVPLTNALYTSQYAIAPLVVTEQFSLDGLNDLYSIVDSCLIGNQNFRNLKILVNKFDRRDNIADEMLEEVRAAYPDDILHTVIRVDKQLEYACRERMPIFEFNPKSKAAEDFSDLADEIINLD